MLVESQFETNNNPLRRFLGRNWGLNLRGRKQGLETCSRLHDWPGPRELTIRMSIDPREAVVDREDLNTMGGLSSNISEKDTALFVCRWRKTDE
jgi:hypothetical protein